MKKSIGLFFILFFVNRAAADSSLSLTAGGYVESNTFYSDQGDRGDSLYSIKPQFLHESQGDTLGFKSDIAGSYNYYSQYSNQNFFDYSVKLAVPINPLGRFGGELNTDVTKISEPAVAEKIIKAGLKKTPSRLDRTLVGGGGGLFWKMSPLSKWNMKGRIQLEIYDGADYTYLTNQSAEGSLFYDYLFLPETTFYIGGEGGLMVYPSGTKNKKYDSSNLYTGDYSPYVKYNSTFAGGRMGVRGRLAEKTRVDASGALLVRAYSVPSSFAEPVFNLKVEEQFGPKDLLMAGFDYEVHDSKWTNYVIDQTTYLAYARIIGDQVLLLSRLQYTYSSFSKPNRREDQRLAGSFKLDYSLGPKSKISAITSIDILNSDQMRTVFDQDIESYDTSVSYEFFKGGLEFTQYF